LRPPSLRWTCRLLLPENLVQRITGAGDIDLVEGDPLLAQRVGDVSGDEGVEDVVAAVHVPVDRLTLGLGQD